MEYPCLAKLRANLFTKLGTYSDLKKHANDKAVIFTNKNSRDIWKENQTAFIIEDQPLPPIPLVYDRYSMDVTEKSINFYKCVIKESVYQRTLVVLFEFEVRGRSEMHVLFTGDTVLQNDPIRAYLKESSPWPTIVRIRQYSNYIDKDCLSYTASKLSPEMRTNLDAKLKIFFDLTAKRSSIATVIFKDEPGFWPIDLKFKPFEDSPPSWVWDGPPNTKPEIKLPIRFPHEPFPLTRDSESRIANVARSVLDYIKEQAAKTQPSMPFYACCSEVGMTAYLEIHLLFTRDESTARSMRAMGGYLTTEDCPEQKIACPSTNATISLETHEQVEKRLSAELKNDLDRRMILFMCRAIEQLPSKAIIFDDERYFWPRFLKIACIRMPLPPLPSKDDYNYEEYDIERDVLDYVKTMAVRKHFSPLFAASFRYEDDLHLLFTKDQNLVHEVASEGYPTTEDHPTDTGVIQFPAEYRFYSSERVDFVKVESTIDRFSRRPKLGTEVTRDGITSSTLDFRADNDENRKFREVRTRLGLRLREYLFAYIHEFNERPQEHTHSAVIFTDDERTWKWFKDAIFVIRELPHIPSFYEHWKYDIVTDMVAFLRRAALEVVGTPIYVIAVTAGEKDRAEVHFLLSRHKELSKQFEFKTGLDPTQAPPSESGSAAGPSTAPHRKLKITMSAPDVLQPSDMAKQFEFEAGLDPNQLVPSEARFTPAVMDERANAGPSTAQHRKLETMVNASAVLQYSDIIDSWIAVKNLRLDEEE